MITMKMMELVAMQDLMTKMKDLEIENENLRDVIASLEDEIIELVRFLRVTTNINVDDLEEKDHDDPWRYRS